MITRRVALLAPLRRCVGSTPGGSAQANLGEITQYLLGEGVPALLQHNYAHSRIHPDAQLRLLPMLPYTPTVQGRRKVEASLSALRLLLTTCVLPRGTDTRIHIHAAHSLLPGVHSPHAVCPQAAKLLVRWATCSPEEHCRHQAQSNATRRWSLAGGGGSMADSGEGVVPSHPVEESGGSPDNSPMRDTPAPGQAGKLPPTGRAPPEITRVLQGIFMFEFSADNSQILVHTIDNVEMIDYEKRVRTTPNISVC